MPLEDLQKLLCMYELDKCSLKFCCQRLNLHRMTAMKYLKLHGVEVREETEWKFRNEAAREERDIDGKICKGKSYDQYCLDAYGHKCSQVLEEIKREKYRNRK